MIRACCAVVLTVLVSLATNVASAETSTRFKFSDGKTTSCTSFTGQPVQQVYLPALAAAMNMGYMGVTIALPSGARTTWDTARLNSVPPEVHDFIYFHECAHAHVPTSDELMANCVGLIDMRNAHRSSVAVEQVLQQYHTSLGFMGPRYGIGSQYWAKTVQCANSHGPAVQLNGNAQATATTTTCSFSSGPKAGQTIDYANQAGVVPAMVGAQCTDGAGSYGTAVPSAPTVGSNTLRGDWQGTLTTPSGTLLVVFHLAAGGVGTADSPNQNVFGMPLQYSIAGSDVNISIPSVNATYIATVNGNQMTGTFGQGGNFPLTLTQGAAAQAQAAPSANPLVGNWQGALVTPVGNLPLIFHLAANGTGTADDLLHNVLGMPLQYSNNGTQVSITIPSVAASYTSTVSGNQMVGTFTQNGIAFQLTLKRH